MESARLRLRRFTLADLPNMRELETNPQIVKFTPYRVPQTEAQTLARLEKVISSDHGSMGIWAVELKENADFVGWFMLLDTKLVYPELGFMIVERHWDKGFATEAAQALVEYGFDKLGMRGVLAITNQGNLASKKVLGRVGFTFREEIEEGDSKLDMYELRKK